MPEDDKPTRLIRRSGQKEKPAAEQPQTTLHRRASKSAPAQAMTTGWLVAVAGPGRGKTHALAYGVNTVGRAPESDVCLHAEDSDVARRNQAQVIYDGRGRKFYIRHGDGKNLTYLNGAPVLQPQELRAGDEISAGKTVLRFAPFCGGDFDWENEPPKK